MSVFLDEYILPEALEKLKENVEVVDNFDNPDDIEGIILRVYPVDKEVMDKCKNLKVIGKHGVGCNTIDLDEAKKRGITVLNTPRANTNSVAELIVGLILDASRNITTAHIKSENGDFQTIAPVDMTGIEVTDKTLGLIGTGNIARRVADILQNGFNVNVVAYDPFVDEETMNEWGYKKYDDVSEMIENADIVNISVPLTPSTENLISGDVFNHFKPDAILINAARGGIINEEDLYEALKSGKLRACACDSLVAEPPTGENTKLYELDNFIGTPHMGATTEEALERMGHEVVDQVLSVLDGNEPVNRVV